jgi:hypothetical protein
MTNEKLYSMLAESADIIVQPSSHPIPSTMKGASEVQENASTSPYQQLRTPTIAFPETRSVELAGKYVCCFFRPPKSRRAPNRNNVSGGRQTTA